MNTKKTYDVFLVNGRYLGRFKGEETIAKTFQMHPIQVSNLVTGRLKSVRGYVVRRVKE